MCGTPIQGEVPFDQILAVARRGAALLVAMGVRDAAVSSAALSPFMLLLDPGRADDLDSFLRDVLGPLLDYDGRRGTQLVETLAAYYLCAENLTRAAQQLHIHVNTLQKRLIRIGELLGPRWRHPDRALSQHLAAQLVVLRDELLARGGPRPPDA